MTQSYFYSTSAATFASSTTITWRLPTPGEDGRRIVRHGLADILLWLGEQPGPVPGDPWCTTTTLYPVPGRKWWDRSTW